MVAAPRYGVATFIGLASRQTYSKDMYVSDVAGGLVTFDGGSGASATSPAYVRFMEPVMLVDLAVATGLTDTTKLSLTRNGTQFGQIIRYATRLDSLSNRGPLSIRFMAGEEIGAIQAA